MRVFGEWVTGFWEGRGDGEWYRCMFLFPCRACALALDISPFEGIFNPHALFSLTITHSHSHFSSLRLETSFDLQSRNPLLSTFSLACFYLLHVAMISRCGILDLDTSEGREREVPAHDRSTRPSGFHLATRPSEHVGELWYSSRVEGKARDRIEYDLVVIIPPCPSLL